jgi:hypothetical protein
MAVIGQVALNIYVEVLCGCMPLFFSGKYLGIEFLGCMGVVHIRFLLHIIID